MASNIPVVLVLFLLPFTPLALANETTAESMIELGSWLSPKGNTSSWASSSGHFAFGFYRQGDGYAVGIWLVGAAKSEDNTVVWTTNRDDPPLSANSTLQLTENGLVLQQGREDQRGLFEVSQPAGSACMLDSGNFVIYGQEIGERASYAVWQSFQCPTDTILGGQNLLQANKLVSSLSKSDHSSGRFMLIFSNNYLAALPLNSLGLVEDANWVSTDVYWYKGSVQVLSLNDEGSLCMSDFLCLTNYTNIGKELQSTSYSIFRATLGVDGDLRLYEHQFEAKRNTKSVVQTLWEAMPDECQIKGFCGFNSYCSNQQQWKLVRSLARETVIVAEHYMLMAAAINISFPSNMAEGFQMHHSRPFLSWLLQDMPLIQTIPSHPR